jgi:aquaglyceroporin related protein
MVLFLEGVVAQVTISKLAAGQYLSISFVTGVAAALGMLIAVPVSGGHLNPAVTLSFVLFRRFPFQKAPGYFVGQVIIPWRQFLPF